MDYKNKIQLYAAYRRLISALKTHTHSKWRDTKDIPANGNQKTAGVVILLSDKIDSKSKSLTRGKEGHNIMMRDIIKEI